MRSGAGTNMPGVAGKTRAKSQPSAGAGRSNASVIVLHSLYNQAADRPYEDAVALFDGLHGLIVHNPHFRREAIALRQIVKGETVLNRLRAEATSF